MRHLPVEHFSPESVYATLFSRLSIRPNSPLPLREAAAYLDITPEHLKELMLKGKIKSLPTDEGPFYYEVSDLEAFMRTGQHDPVPRDEVEQDVVPNDAGSCKKTTKKGRERTINVRVFMRAYRDLISSGLTKSEAIDHLAPNHDTYGIGKKGKNHQDDFYESVKSSMRRIIRDPETNKKE